MRRLLIILAAVSLPTVAAGCGSPAPSAAMPSIAAATQAPPTVGNSVTMDATGAVRVTVLVHDGPQPTGAPASGMQQLAFIVDVANTGRAGAYPYSGTAGHVLFLVDADGHVYYPSDTGGVLDSAASLEPGKSVQGTVVFTVPDGDTPDAIRFMVTPHSAAQWGLPGIAT